MELFTPAWKSKNKKRALRAVEKIADQKKLAKVAKESEHEDVRVAAVEKLTDQTVLADIAKNDNDANIRVLAACKLLDTHERQSILISLAKTVSKPWLRRRIINSLNMQQVAQSDLAEIVVHLPAMNVWNERETGETTSDIPDTELSIMIINNWLTDPKWLEYVIHHCINNWKDWGWKVRKTATIKRCTMLTNQAELADIAINDPDCDVRRKAVEKLTLPDTLFHIAKNDKDEWVRNASKERLNHPDLHKAVEELRLQQAMENFQDSTVKCLHCRNEMQESDKLQPLESNGKVIEICADCRGKYRFYEIKGHIVKNDNNRYDGRSECLLCGLSFWYDDEGELQGNRLSDPCKNAE
jgi:hypothetical protein